MSGVRETQSWRGGGCREIKSLGGSTNQTPVLVISFILCRNNEQELQTYSPEIEQTSPEIEHV